MMRDRCVLFGRWGAGENFDSVNPKGAPVSELIAWNYKPGESGIRTQRRAVLAVRHENLLAREIWIKLSYCEDYLVTVRTCYFDVLESATPGMVAFDSCSCQQIPERDSAKRRTLRASLCQESDVYD